MLEYEPKDGRVRIDVKKSFGKGVVIKQIRWSTGFRQTRVFVQDKPLEMFEGACWEAFSQQ